MGVFASEEKGHKALRERYWMLFVLRGIYSIFLANCEAHFLAKAHIKIYIQDKLFFSENLTLFLFFTAYFLRIAKGINFKIVLLSVNTTFHPLQNRPGNFTLRLFKGECFLSFSSNILFGGEIEMSSPWIVWLTLVNFCCFIHVWVSTCEIQSNATN